MDYVEKTIKLREEKIATQKAKEEAARKQEEERYKEAKIKIKPVYELVKQFHGFETQRTGKLIARKEKDYILIQSDFRSLKIHFQNIINRYQAWEMEVRGYNQYKASEDTPEQLMERLCEILSEW